MSEISFSPEMTENKPPYEVHSSQIEAKNGKTFTSSLYILNERLGDLPDTDPLKQLSPQIIRVANASFTHWSDNGRTSFAEKTLPNSKALTVIMNEANEVVGFNRYTIGEVEGAKYMYANYAGVDPAEDSDGNPLYRRIGLMERSRIRDVSTIDPAILAGCSAVGEIHMGIARLSQELGRVMYPTEPHVPEAVGKLGQKVYGAVNGEHNSATVEVDTLVRHGASSYAQGTAEYPLFDQLQLSPNDAVLYLSLSEAYNKSLVGEQPQEV